MPRTSAPTKVAGRLCIRPTTAAAYAETTSRLSVLTSRLRPGAMRMAASPASIEPRAQEAAVTRFGLRPFTAHSSGLSTTARIATPSRVRLNRRRRPKATATAASTVVTWSQVMTRPLIVKLRSPHRPGEGAQLDPPDGQRQPLEREEERQGDDQLGGHGRALEQAPHDEDVEQHADQRRAHAEGGEQREGRRPPPVDPQLPVHEGEEHAHCTVGEVEHARGDVGDDEPRRGDRVDRGDGDAQHQVREERLQAHRAHPPESR